MIANFVTFVSGELAPEYWAFVWIIQNICVCAYLIIPTTGFLRLDIIFRKYRCVCKCHVSFASQYTIVFKLTSESAFSRVNHRWAASWQNQQNGMCTQRRLRSAWASAQSDQGLRCSHEETLGFSLPIERIVKTLIRLGSCPGWSESSLGAHIILLVLLCRAQLFSCQYLILHLL